MPDLPISLLPAVVAVTGTDEFAVNQAGTTMQATTDQIEDRILRANNITDLEAGDRIAQHYRRQGGAATPAWGTIGVTDYTMAGDGIRVQFGARRIVVANGAAGNTAVVTYGQAYQAGGTCIILLTLATGTVIPTATGNKMPVCYVSAQNNTTVTIGVVTADASVNNSGGNVNIDVFWQSIGPE